MIDSPISKEDLPALFRSADRLSCKGQVTRKRLLVIALALDVVASALGGYRRSTVSNEYVLLILIIGLSFTVWLLLTRPEGDWYLGRSLAESVKTLAWRYMMCSEPYDFGLPQKGAEHSFVLALNRLIQQHPQIGSGLAPAGGQDVQVTDRMRSLRALPVEDRLAFYVRYRIQDQQEWYCSRGLRARHMAGLFRGLIVGFQALACLAALYLVLHPETNYSAIGLLTTVVASFAAWQQLNQAESLAQAYGIAAQELASAQSLVSQITTENELSDFVVSVERAVSREHTMWLARRKYP